VILSDPTFPSDDRRRRLAMRKWIQRIRGAIGMGLTWAAGWTPIGAAVGAVLHYILPGIPIGLGSVVILNATTFAALGFVGGTLFSTVLRLTEGQRRFDELSLPRFAAWGAVGGLVLGGVAVAAGLWGASFGPLGGSMIAVAAILGAGSAAGSLALARRANDRELLRTGSDVADVGLTAAERHQLLGSGS
jgi:hypothetical protein